MSSLSHPWGTSIVEYQEERSPLIVFRNHKDILQEQPSAPPLLSSLLPGDQKALPKAVMCPGRSNPNERAASPLVFLSSSIPLRSFLQILGLSFFFFPFSPRFPHLSLENGSGLTPSSTLFFLGAVMLLSLRFPSDEKGRLRHIST